MVSVLGVQEISHELFLGFEATNPDGLVVCKATEAMLPSGPLRGLRFPMVSVGRQEMNNDIFLGFGSLGMAGGPIMLRKTIRNTYL